MLTLTKKLAELQGEVTNQKTRENELLTQIEDIKHAKVRYIRDKTMADKFMYISNDVT